LKHELKRIYVANIEMIQLIGLVNCRLWF